MNVTWVLGYPTGHEQGSFLTVDLGGTNLRVCYITLPGSRDKEFEVDQQKYKLPNEIKSGTAEQLWDFLSDCLQKFVEEKGLKGTKKEPIYLGFTFSYPALQEYIDHGILQTWTKGFDIKGVEGENAAGQLQEALDKRQLPIKMIALINDTTGAMIASAYKDPKTIMGVIFGTGCNGAYMEQCGKITKLKDSGLPSDTLMAINCEYGAFDNARRVLPLTPYDEAVDRDSPRPGEQAWEKMSAGLYLGEIFRLVLVDLAEKGLVFKDQDTTKLREAYALDTGALSAIEDDESPKLSETRTLFKDVLSLDITEPELELCRRLAELIAVRGARLCACGVAAICSRNQISSGHVAADGSVANKHPKFKRRWGKALGELLDWPKDQGEDPVVLTSAEDGSGIGAAVIAAMTLERAEKGQRAGIRSF
ncbi:hypothetical protein K402DRAFT_346560 [Aulographum hederae CBS 113979]|uniref:Phosphotransferase n=1 Tax=Aulographum hederae CBS 113979 TaxID=1176131 RepID=A0A6G1HES0_9PEZI|nr:hypothetical protein K402DRAFT_346560 [Aulographum hederae CBS 113979]